MAETMQQIGERLLGAKREDRHLRAIALYVWALNVPGGSDQAQRIPAMFMDALERKLATATGGRRRGLLEVYGLLLDCIEVALADVPTRRPAAS